MIKVITTRKDHKCDTCEKDIPKGSWAEYFEHRFPRHDDKDNQIGINFYKSYMCKLCHDELTNDLLNACGSLMINNCIEQVKNYSI